MIMSCIRATRLACLDSVLTAARGKGDVVQATRSRKRFILGVDGSGIRSSPGLGVGLWGFENRSVAGTVLVLENGSAGRK